MKVKFTPRGDLRAQKAAAWWRKNRPDTSEQVDAKKEEIRILMIWGAPRGEEPKL